MFDLDGVLEKLLYEAQHEKDVETILTDENLLDQKLWQPIGGDYSNETIIRAQSSSPEGALGERIINSIDSVLMRKCYEQEIDPRSNRAPKSMCEAAEKLLNLPEGKLANFEGEYNDITEIFCTATGREPEKLTLNLMDLGEGQTPDNMEHTFLSLPIGKDRPYKKGIPFVQGRYNQGSSGSYKFSPYTLIVTKRPPSLLTTNARKIIDQYNPGKSTRESYNRKNQWGWTIIKKFERHNDAERTWFGYLAPNKEMPSYDASTLKLMPKKSIPTISDKLSDKEKKTKLRELKSNASSFAYAEEVEGGSLVKLFDFPFKKCLRADIWSEGAREMRGKIFYETVLPIKMTELREWGNRIKGKGDSAYLTGLLNSILRENKKKPLVWKNYPKDENIRVNKVWPVKITKWILEKTDDRWLSGTSVVYVLNGQVHFREKSSYLKQLKLYNLEGSLLVVVDVNKIPINIRDKIFRVDRTFLEETDEAELLKDKIKYEINNDDEIRKINDSKLAELASDTKITQEKSQKIIKKLVKEIPELAKLLIGSKIPLLGGGVELKKFKGEKYKNVKFGTKSPTFFQVLKKFRTEGQDSK